MIEYYYWIGIALLLFIKGFLWGRYYQRRKYKKELQYYMDCSYCDGRRDMKEEVKQIKEGAKG